MSADCVQSCMPPAVSMVPQEPMLEAPVRQGGLTVTKLTTRPKTSVGARPTSVRYVCGPKSSITVLGDRMTPDRCRPRTSVSKRERSERVGSGSQERNGPRDTRELLLPICTTNTVRFSGADRELLGITTPTRLKSAGGPRPLSFMSSRDRSAALLKELSLSLSLLSP